MLLTSIHDVTIDIGGTPILVRTESAYFAHLLEDRYGEFVIADASTAVIELEIRLMEEEDGTRDTGYGIRDTGLGTRDSGLGTRDSGLGTRDSGLDIRNPESA